MDLCDLTVPPARTDGLLVRSLREEVLVYDLDRQEAHCLDPAAARVWQACDGATTVGTLAARLAPDLSDGAGVPWVWQTLQALEGHRLLGAPLPQPNAAVGLSRRKFLQLIGQSAVALPAIVSFIPPPPPGPPHLRPLLSCRQKGEVCTDTAQCCTGSCVNGFCA